MDEGHTYAQLYESFKIYPAAIEDWRKLLEQTGSLKPQYRETRKRKIDKEALKRAVEEKPDAYLSELAAPFGCTEQAVFYALKKLKGTPINLCGIERREFRHYFIIHAPNQAGRKVPDTRRGEAFAEDST
jgi:transposase